MKFDTKVLEDLGKIQFQPPSEEDQEYLQEFHKTVKMYLANKDLNGLKKYLTHQRNELRNADR